MAACSHIMRIPGTKKSRKLEKVEVTSQRVEECGAIKVKDTCDLSSSSGAREFPGGGLASKFAWQNTGKMRGRSPTQRPKEEKTLSSRRVLDSVDCCKRCMSPGPQVVSALLSFHPFFSWFPDSRSTVLRLPALCKRLCVGLLALWGG